MTRDRYLRTGLAIAVLVLLADQASKWAILSPIDLPGRSPIVLAPVLNLTFVRNSGVTFGLLNGFGEWGHLLLAGLAICVVAALGVWLRRAETRLTAIALGAIAGGAIGNVIDRLRFGWVVDFIDAHLGNWHWYVFNLADAAIVCGVIALVIDSQWPRRAPADQARA
ncbi:MAG TPA: signal peptidase II [Acetobacteraceae bacterium]|nr:signal peptidase II [Acetobacteraceae bacterium]